MKRNCPKCGSEVEGIQQTLLGFPMVIMNPKNRSNMTPALYFGCVCGFECHLTGELAEHVETLPADRED